MATTTTTTTTTTTIPSNDEAFFNLALLTMYVSAAINIISLQFITAPYGKHAQSGWGPTIPPPLAWFLMESPTLWLTLLLYPRGRHSSDPLSLLLTSLFLLHYAHRTLIYPLRLLLLSRKNPNPNKPHGFPLLIASCAFLFNLLNAYLQTRSASHYAHYSSTGVGLWTWVRVLVGLGIFAWGMRVNVAADLALVRLKTEGGGYKVPRGGWFELVCSPNYMGEAAEWLGWAVVAWTPAAFGFFVYTCSNLVPRARANLRWYREKFGEDYPRSRKAILPFLY